MIEQKIHLSGDARMAQNLDHSPDLNAAIEALQALGWRRIGEDMEPLPPQGNFLLGFGVGMPISILLWGALLGPLFWLF